MGYIKCPRCELNYMPDTERYCSVCKREMRGEDEHDEIELCSACGENPVVPGEELCAACLKELTRQEGEKANEGEENVVSEEGDVTALDATSDLEEIDIDVDEDIPSTEYSEIHKELGMDDDVEEGEEEDGRKTRTAKRKINRKGVLTHAHLCNRRSAPARRAAQADGYFRCALGRTLR